MSAVRRWGFSTFLCLFLLFSFKVMQADPGALYFDPGMMHQMMGVNRVPTDVDDWKFDLHISPFYQHASGARDKCGKKVNLGDRLGRWNMLALLWGDMNAAPKDFTQENYGILYTLSNHAANMNETGGYSPDGPYSIDPEGFGGELDLDGNYSIPVSYEKKGLRMEFDVGLTSGFGLTIKGGIVDYSMCPTFIDMSTTTEDPLKSFLSDTLMTQTMREALLETELGYDISRYETVGFEDTFVQFFWSLPVDLEDRKGRHVVTVSPYFGAGVWIPTGKKQDPDKMFAMSTGHDGFWGVTLEAAVGCEFPRTIMLNVGGSITIFETKSQCLRVPNHKYQTAIYPFKTSVKRTFGPAWNFNCSMHANDIADNLSVYFDYLYSKHEKDTIHIKSCDDTTRDAFLPKLLEEVSSWRSHMVNLGFKYYVSPNLSFGLAGQTHISGVRVFKTHTVMGTINFTF